MSRRVLEPRTKNWGMPSFSASVVRQAQAALQALQNEQQALHAQVDLFAAAPEVMQEAAAPSAVEAALESLDVDGLTPRQAQEALYRLKALLDQPPASEGPTPALRSIAP